MFTLFYHDSIYNSQRQDNEEKSAVLAEERMKTLDVPRDLIDLCSYQIRATKSHVKSDNQDTNYFTDADFSILGKAWDEYSIYTQNVRKEFAIYPDSIYTKGRKKVLKHFLEMERIYKTDYFYQKYEEKAKLNMQRELELL
ncbi:HD domain-containing protein [Wenyingzhuangia sp. IMCC45574]